MEDIEALVDNTSLHMAYVLSGGFSGMAGGLAGPSLALALAEAPVASVDLSLLDTCDFGITVLSVAYL